ncbi:hypothetical protein HYDPIDRAFT_105034 [Hydnomerulius pinastri MD-312]|nr:hypothetical protein HYDPIDRAFT_105034 [Hydnomerulius pinastri MD-312]
MQMRVYAMCDRSRTVLQIMLLCFFLEIISTSALLGYHMPNNTTSHVFDQMCSSNVDVTGFVILYLPTLVFELVLLLLVLDAVRRHVLQTRRYTGRWQISPIVKTLTIYSVLYFLAVVFCFGAILIVPKQNFYVPAAFLLSSLIILATRLVLAIREPRPALSLEIPPECVWVVNSPDSARTLRISISSPMTDIFTIEELESPRSARALDYA